MATYKSTHTGQQIDAGVDAALNPDVTVTPDSGALVTSGAVADALENIDPTITSDTDTALNGILAGNGSKVTTKAVDSAPTASSTNLVTSGGVKNALDNKQNILTFDSTPTSGSTNPVTSAGIRAAIDQVNSSPLVAATASAMTDTSKVYVYTGSDAGYTNGHWYYYNGSAWADGGVYNAVAVNTDTTLTLPGVPADAKAAGDAVSELKSAITNIEDRVGDIEEISLTFTNGKAIYYSNGKASNSSVLSYSGYNKIPEGYTKLRLAMVIRPDNVNTGMAFYTSNAESAYISGKKNKIDSTITGFGSEIIEIPIPSTAQYFRTSWIATTNPSYSSNTFYCAFVKTGTMETEFNQIETDLGKVESVADSNKMLTYILHNLVDYQNETNYDLPASGSTTETAIGVKREGNLFTLNGSNTSRAVTIRASGAVERAIYSSDVNAWSSDLVFPAGKSYKAVLTPVSGTVSYSGDNIPVGVSVYKQGTSNTQGTAEYDGHTYTRYFVSDGSAYIIALYVNEDAVFTNAEYLLYLEEIVTNTSFYAEEMADTIAKVRGDITEPAIVCPIITDEHRYVPGVVQNFSDMVLNVRSFSESIECDALINLGDMVEGDEARATTKQYANSCNKDIKTIGLPYLFISGNHDPNPYYNNKAQMFTPAEMFAYYYAGTKNVIFNMAENGTEYYLDYPELNTRMVFINSSVASNNSIYSFGPDTGAWLADTVLDTNYKVLLFVHVSPYASQVVGETNVGNSSSVRTAINNFILGGGELIMISGHSHRDMAFHTPHISVMNGCQKFENGDSETSATATITGYIDQIVKPVRTDDTATKDLWTIMVFKPVSNEIDFIRFGAGFDRYFHANPVGSGMLTSKLTGTLTWHTTDSAVATVSDGTVTIVGEGRCAVWAKEAETENYECWIVQSP